MIVPIPYVLAGVGLVASLEAIPLVLRKVPMNRWYGIRLRKAFASERNWYEINAYGGKAIFWYGVALMALGWFGREWMPPATSLWAVGFLALPLLAVVPVLVAIHRFARRLPEGRTEAAGRRIGTGG